MGVVGRRYHMGIKKCLIISTSIAGILICTSIVALANVPSNGEITPTSQKNIGGHMYPINQNGQSYGKYICSTKEVSNEQPDLIAATGVGGKDGYVKKTDLQPDISIDESAKRNEKAYKIPVYNKDGTTVIDFFEITD